MRIAFIASLDPAFAVHLNGTVIRLFVRKLHISLSNCRDGAIFRHPTAHPRAAKNGLSCLRQRDDRMCRPTSQSGQAVLPLQDCTAGILLNTLQHRVHVN